MMGQHYGQKEMFSYTVDLDRRVRADHPLRAIRRLIDFSFVQVALNNAWLHAQGVPDLRAKWIALHYGNDNAAA